MPGELTAANLAIFIVALLISVGFHEAMHAFMAHWLGDTTASEEGRLTLNPIKHLDLYTSIALPVILVLLRLPPFFAAKPVPFNPARVKYDEYGAAMIGLAGPLTNLGLAGLTALFLNGAGEGLSLGVIQALVTFLAINVALFVFNMIPFPPLDGSRLVYAFAPEPLQRVMYQIESMGFMAIVLFMFLLVPVLGPLITTVNSAIISFLL